MLYTTKGTLVQKGEIKSGVSQRGNHWQRMDILVEVPSFQGSTIKQTFAASNDTVEDLDNFKEGDKVLVSWSMYAREYNGRWYNNVDIVKIAADGGETMKVTSATPKAKVAAKPAPAPAESLEPEADDLPF